MAQIMNKNNMKKQAPEHTSSMPDLTNAEEVRKAVIAAEILQRKW